MLYDQRREKEFLEASESSGRGCERLKPLWSEDFGVKEEHDDVIILSKLCAECPP